MKKYNFTNNRFKSPAQQACAVMTDKQIEDLLHEKIENLHFYAHYDLAQHDARLSKIVYNNNPVKCDDNAFAMHKTMKQEMDARVPNFELLVHAVKTVEIDQYPVKDGAFVENPAYAPQGRCVVGNIIFRDAGTGQIHTLDRWIGVYTFSCADFAAARGASTFADCATGLLKFRHALEQEILRTRGLVRNI